MTIMGWSSVSMAKRYQHLIDSTRQDDARQVGGLLWSMDDNNPEKAEPSL
jgi:integrase